MDNADKLPGGITAIFAGLFTYLFGGYDVWFGSFVGLVILDYLTGVLAAVITKTLSSKIGLNGILKKLLLLSVVAVANIVDDASGAGGALRVVVIGYLMGNEGVSILENTGRAGMKWPPKLMAILKQLKSNGEEEK